MKGIDMTGVYLKCDFCGETLGVEKVVKDKNPHWTHTHLLQKQACLLGWVGKLDRASSTDKCPECAKRQVQLSQPA
jgi:uncharacterized Zn finger protein